MLNPGSGANHVATSRSTAANHQIDISVSNGPVVWIRGAMVCNDLLPIRVGRRRETHWNCLPVSCHWRAPGPGALLALASVMGIDAIRHLQSSDSASRETIDRHRAQLKSVFHTLFFPKSGVHGDPQTNAQVLDHPVIAAWSLWPV